MGNDGINECELEEFETFIGQAIGKATSLEELELWLQSQPCVLFVKLEEYVVKTFPPRREFRIVLKMKGGLIQERVLTIQETQDDKLEFVNMR